MTMFRLFPLIFFLLLLLCLFSNGFAQPEQDSYHLSAGEAVVLDNAGNIYVAGSIIVNLAFGPGRSEDVFLAKYDSNGNQLAYKQFATKEIESIADIVIAENGDVFVSGIVIRDLKTTSPQPYTFFSNQI